MLDSGIAKRSGSRYASYNSGRTVGAFLFTEMSNYTGQTAAGDAAFPDFFNSGFTMSWWKN